jgi:hypothetical protein
MTPYEPKAAGPCLSPAQENQMIRRQRARLQAWVADGTIPPARARNEVRFSLPVRQADFLDHPGFFAISYFVDHDTQEGVRDFNCGGRAYDGHTGAHDQPADDPS